MSISHRSAFLRLTPSLLAAALLLALPGCPPADPGGGSGAPAATAPPASDPAPAADSSDAAATTEAADTEAADTEAAGTESEAGDPAADPAATEEVATETGDEAHPAGESTGDEGTHEGTDVMIDDVFGAFKASDFDKIASFRPKLEAAIVDELMTHYKTSLSWEIKDGFTHLMVHRYEAVVIPLMTDSLLSERVESRAQAIATLRQAKDMIGTMHDDKGGIDPSKVADAIKEYRLENPL
jgi:hypothetical protein